MSDIIIRTEGLSKNFGSIYAVKDVSLEIPDKQVRAIIGPNGAGKSTLMDLITNRTKPSSGHTFFDSKEITQLPSYKIADLGVGKCFQISKLFSELSVYENVQIACINQKKRIYDMFGSGKNAFKEETMEILEAIGIADKKDETAGYLSYGDQRRLEIGVTLGMRPRVLMLDEPTAGVARAEGYNVMKLVRQLAEERGLTIIYIEHDMDIVFNYSDEISVMNQGQLIATGTPQEIKENKFVQDSYLGDLL